MGMDTQLRLCDYETTNTIEHDAKVTHYKRTLDMPFWGTKGAPILFSEIGFVWLHVCIHTAKDKPP